MQLSIVRAVLSVRHGACAGDTLPRLSFRLFSSSWLFLMGRDMFRLPVQPGSCVPEKQLPLGPSSLWGQPLAGVPTKPWGSLMQHWGTYPTFLSPFRIYERGLSHSESKKMLWRLKFNLPCLLFIYSAGTVVNVVSPTTSPFRKSARLLGLSKNSVNCVTLNKKIGAINHIHIKRMNRVALLGISNEKAKRYRRQTTSVVHYPHYLKHVNKNPHGHRNSSDCEIKGIVKEWMPVLDKVQ